MDDCSVSNIRCVRSVSTQIRSEQRGAKTKWNKKKKKLWILCRRNGWPWRLKLFSNSQPKQRKLIFVWMSKAPFNSSGFTSTASIFTFEIFSWIWFNIRIKANQRKKCGAYNTIARFTYIADAVVWWRAYCHRPSWKRLFVWYEWGGGVVMMVCVCWPFLIKVF